MYILSKKIINEVVALNNITRIVSPEYSDELSRVRLLTDKKPQNILNIQRNQPIAITSTLITTLNMMLHIEMPHVNLLSKIDLIEQYGKLAFNIDFFTEVLDLNYLICLKLMF